MSLLERVQELAKQQGLSIKRLEEECELSNATIRRWENQTPNIESVRRVAHKLKVTIDYLVNGDSLNTISPRFEVYCDGVPLSEAEADLVAMYRILDDRDREDVFDYLTLKYQKATGEKGSVYATYTDTNEQQKSEPTSGGRSASGIA